MNDCSAVPAAYEAKKYKKKLRQRNVWSTICCLTNWCGCSTIVMSDWAQRAAVCLKPAPGNQAGICRTVQLLRRAFR